MFTRQLIIIYLIPGGVLPVGHMGHPLILVAEILIGFIGIGFLLIQLKGDILMGRLSIDKKRGEVKGWS